MHIRRATPDDAETILELVRALAHYEKEPDAVQATAETFRAQLAADAPPFECVIAEIDARAAGFALYFHNYSTWRGKRGLYVEDLFVLPEFRRRGIGRRLFQHLAAIARERNCARMEWAVLDWNQPAIDFYQSLGARPLSEWTTFRLSDEPLAALAGQ